MTFKIDFIAFKMKITSIRKRIAEKDAVNDVTVHVRAEVLLHVWSHDCYDTTLSTE